MSLAEARCVSCKKLSEQEYETGGWWQLPEGWFVCESALYGKIYACSRSCAQDHEKSVARFTPPPPKPDP